jgi:HD superfamily phosphohydrolase
LDAQELRKQIAGVAPALWKAVAKIAQSSLDPISNHLDRTRSSDHFPKTINDPIWGTIELYPWEVAILDSPLLQRLRGVSQLGLAYYVYPGASHSRLEHVLGVTEAADRMMRALERNAENHRKFGLDKDPEVPRVTELDRHSVRLGALLHDIGHGPFSHVTEPLLRGCLRKDFEEAEGVLRAEFEGVTNVATSETVAVLLVLSEEMRRVFEHPHFEAVKESTRLAPAIAARILGSRAYLNAGYLSGMISGPVDADKIDYMARDSHHSGFPIGLDLNRLISKLEVITITPENTQSEQLRQRAIKGGGRVYEMGISLSGLGAYEQMIIGRVLLYDRLYYHHKVRAAESMLRRLVDLAGEESYQERELSEFFELFSEGEYLSLWSGVLELDSVVSGGDRSRVLGKALASRHVYHRAFAFAPRFIAGLDGLPENERRETRILQYDGVVSALRSEEGRTNFAMEIYELAKELGAIILELRDSAANILPEHVLIDFPVNKTVVRGNDILTRTEAGAVVPPNLFFDPEKWSQAYEHQKQVGHVFAPREHVPLVCIASKIAFYNKFNLLMGRDAENASKTFGVVKTNWIEQVRDRQACSAECAEALLQDKPKLLQISTANILLPDGWKSDDPNLSARLAQGFDDAIPGGLPSSAHQRVLRAIRDLATFVERVEKDGTFSKIEDLSEKTLQQELKKHLLSREVPVREGEEVGGGETDLVLYDAVVVENKVRNATSDPFGSGSNYPYQSRRYSIAMLQRVSFVVIAYRPANENAVLPLSQRIRVSKFEGAPEDHAQVRVVIPWGSGVPSTARAPKEAQE